jgi:hypothetical protein
MTSDPGPVVLEMRAERRDEAYVRRVTADGRVWVRSSGGMDEGGWPAGEGEWEVLETLPEPVLEQLRRAIVDAGFFDAPEENPPEQTVIGGGAETWTADVDGRRHVVRVLGAPVNEVPAVSRVAVALEEALAAAE